MSYKYLQKSYNEICDNITNKKLADAFLQVGKQLSESNNSELIRSFEKQKQTYNYLLEYTFKGIDDPERPKIYKQIQLKLLEIAQSITDEKFLNSAENKLSLEKRVLDSEIERNKITIECEIKDLVNKKYDLEDTERKSGLQKLFFLIWLSNEISENDIKALKKAAVSRKLFYQEKSIITSALTISLIRRFDKNKFFSLFDFYNANEDKVWQRALVGIIISFYIYNKRIYLYDGIFKKLKQIKKDDKIEQYIEDIVLQLIRTKETEKISRKLRDEIIPEMQKFKPKIEEKLNLDDILSDSLIEDQNPDWEEIFDDSPDLLNKMADFSKLQLEGSDVFMSAFAMFKNFPFFQQTANWFMPFYAKNDEVIKAFSGFDDNFDTKAFAEGLERSAFMCNSDKYSFCMNVQMMPKTQRSMIVELFKAEMQQMKEISDDEELLNKDTQNKYIFTKYIQDLYRFFKLHPLHKNFNDFFNSSLDIHNTLFFKTIINDNELIQKISNLYFKKEFYKEAIDILSKIDLKGEKARKNYEKLGFAWQKLKNYDKALLAYQKAELFKNPSLWLTKKIAFCFRKNHNYKEALKYYKIAEKEDKDNLHIQGNIAHCYLSMDKYEKALNKYFKVEYYEPDNMPVQRPIAWCSFVLGKLETSEKYYLKLLKSEPTAYDYINYGHVLFCKDEKMKAVDMYLNAIEIKDLKTFEAGIIEDKDIILKYSSKNTDIDLLVDYVKSKII